MRDYCPRLSKNHVFPSCLLSSCTGLEDVPSSCFHVFDRVSRWTRREPSWTQHCYKHEFVLQTGPKKSTWRCNHTFRRLISLWGSPRSRRSDEGLTAAWSEVLAVEVCPLWRCLAASQEQFDADGTLQPFLSAHGASDSGHDVWFSDVLTVTCCLTSTCLLHRQPGSH